MISFKCENSKIKEKKCIFKLSVVCVSLLNKKKQDLIENRHE